MLFNTNLEEIIFRRHEMVESNELVVLSGYLGPNPVARLANLPINSTVIYGMYGDKGIQYRLHNALINCQLNIPHVNIYYSTVPIHSKCYIWKNNNVIKHALIGSANFSTNGLSTPYREILAETTYDTFQPLHEYVDRVMQNAILCTDLDLSFSNNIITQAINVGGVCQMSLLDNYGNVPLKSGLNWGHGTGNVVLNDAYIAIRKEHIRNCPYLFPPKQDFTTMYIAGGRSTRHNDLIEIIWDDGTTMDGLLEGSQDENGVKYPKQISSLPRKSLMGEYLRYRLGVPLGQRVTVEDLQRYGRMDISISLQDEGIYYCDFSV